MRRNLPDAPAAGAPRLEPLAVVAAPVERSAPVPRATPPDEIGLDIPTFLRRQSN